MPIAPQVPELIGSILGAGLTTLITFVRRGKNSCALETPSPFGSQEGVGS